MSRYVACYDIRSNSQRARMAELLLEYGRRGQASVFEIDVDPEEIEEIRLRVGLQLAKSGLFDFLPVECRQPKRRLSWHRDPPLPDKGIVV